MDKKGISISSIITFIVFFVMLLSAMFTNFESPLRYIKYLLFIPIGCFLLLIPFKQIKFSKVLFQNILLYSFLIFVNFFVSIYSGYLSSRYFQESLLILLPLICVFLISGLQNLKIEDLLNKLFIVYIIAFVSFFWNELFHIHILLKSFINALKLSEFPTESWMAFPFGLFLMYYIDKKDKIRIIFSLIFFLLCFKRITFLAFFVAQFSYWIINRCSFIKFSKYATVKILVFLNLLLIVFIYLFVNGYFTKFIKRHTGITINHFSQGRFRIYNDTINYFSDDIFLGTSLGSTSVFLSNKFKDISFLHSDLLKLILELGIILFIIWLISFMVLNLVNKRVLPLLLFINILFISDNVFIYFDTLFIFYLLILYYNKNNELNI